MLCLSAGLVIAILAILVVASSVSAREHIWKHPLDVQDLFVSIALFPFEEADGGHESMDIRRQIISSLEKSRVFDYAFYCPEGEQLETLSSRGFVRTGNDRPLPVRGYWGPSRIHYLVFGRYSVAGDGTRIEVFLYEIKSEKVLLGRAYRASGFATQEMAAAIARTVQDVLLQLEPKSKQKRDSTK